MKMNRTLASLLLAFLLFALAAPLVALDRQPGADYRARRVALSHMVGSGVVVLFGGVEEEGPNALYGYRQDNDFYYLSGWAEPGAALLIAPEVPATDDAPARPYSEVLFLPAHNRTQERWTGPKLAAGDVKAAEVTGFDRVASLDQMHEEIASVVPARALVYTAVQPSPQTTPSSVPLQWLARTNAFGFVHYEDVSGFVAELRKHKDAGEIERIRHATDASIAAHRDAMKAMHPGLYEYQIAALMQYRHMDAGCEREAYSPIVGSGPNSTVLHYGANTRKIEDGDLVVMDVAGEYAMYASDITRTLPANGHYTPRQREIYNIVLGAQQAAMKAVQPGTTVLTGRSPESLYKVAYDYINTHGKDLHGQPLGQYFIHGLGHRVGLEVHDVGAGPVDRGDVFTIEPGIYIPEEKIGVRIEDIVMIDESGKLVNLTADLPHTAEDVEAAMHR